MIKSSWCLTCISSDRVPGHPHACLEGMCYVFVLTLIVCTYSEPNRKWTLLPYCKISRGTEDLTLNYGEELLGPYKGKIINTCTR